ncbi:TPA: hypothetical protein HA244_06320 [Candidatus Micrarchaeota archaeon]|nr:hypothetical protein [Candidatus Micrarchaeota archaeon]
MASYAELEEVRDNACRSLRKLFMKNGVTDFRFENHDGQGIHNPEGEKSVSARHFDVVDDAQRPDFSDLVFRLLAQDIALGATLKEKGIGLDVQEFEREHRFRFHFY